MTHWWQHLLMINTTHWWQLTLIDDYWHLLMMINTCWCWSTLIADQIDDKTIDDNWWQLMTIDDNFDVWNGSLHVMVMDRLTHGWTKLFFKYCKWKCRMSLQNWNIYLSFDRFWINWSVLMLIKSWELEQIFVSFK